MIRDEDNLDAKVRRCRRAGKLFVDAWGVVVVPRISGDNMHPAFSTILYGPFHTAYHRAVVDDAFKEALGRYLEGVLLPQVDEVYEWTRGTLVPEVNEERFCGPRSVVRDNYKLEFVFGRKDSEDKVSKKIRWTPKAGSFGPLRGGGNELYLLARARQAKLVKCKKSGEIAVRQLLSGEDAESTCGSCSASLGASVNGDMVEVICPNRCFVFRGHFELDSRVMKSAHFWGRPL